MLGLEDNIVLDSEGHSSSKESYYGTCVTSLPQDFVPLALRATSPI